MHRSICYFLTVVSCISFYSKPTLEQTETIAVGSVYGMCGLMLSKSGGNSVSEVGGVNRV